MVAVAGLPMTLSFPATSKERRGHGTFWTRPYIQLILQARGGSGIRVPCKFCSEARAQSPGA